MSLEKIVGISTDGARAMFRNEKVQQVGFLKK
jgi:hypothetical protein